MRILLVHNFYGSSAPSGENAVVLEEAQVLRKAGHEVIEHFVYSDSVRDRGLLRLLGAAAVVPWNQAALVRLRRVVRERTPDVMHVHNVFPLLSPAIFRAAAGTRTAVVNTLHNYRIACANAAFLRNRQVCTLCSDRRSVLPALRYGCYRNSRVATFPLAACIALHRGARAYARHVDAFVALTDFQRNILIRAGLPPERTYTKPNCMPAPVRCLPWDQRESKAAFIGRVSQEKGLDVLLKAWALWGPAAPRLEIIGGGPELDCLRNSIPNEIKDRVDFLGPKPLAETYTRLASARLLIIPSIWFEAFPLVLREALAFAVPVVASRLGAFLELVEPRDVGRLFTAGDPQSLFQTVVACWNDDPALQLMSVAARAEFEARYSPAANVTALASIYRRAMHHKQSESASCVTIPC
jgi:glycosyltransferase involved in cell wall biosynthesis